MSSIDSAFFFEDTALSQVPLGCIQSVGFQHKAFLETAILYICMQIENRKRWTIITFLGAGASAPFGYPTTKSLLWKLDSFLSGEEKRYLNSIMNLHWVVEDVEHVVEILDSILELERSTKKGRLSSFLFRYPLFLDFSRKNEKQHYYSPSLDEKIGWNQIVQLSEGLRDKVEELTFQEYESRVAQFTRIKREYEKYFSMLRHHSKGTEFEVFTTNYDNVVEDYCHRSGTSCTLSILNREVNPNVESTKNRIVLTKLHGSLDWLIDKETRKIEFANTQARIRKNSPRWDRNEYVLFGTKARLGEEGIYDKLFDKLRDSVNEADICVVIGFSFRDRHIAQIFNESMLKNTTLRLIIVSRSPMAAAKNLVAQSGELKRLVKQKRIATLRCSFGTVKAINQMNVTLFSL
jgi:NAD-dependent SIR2 family protein deacetylase